MKLTTLACSAAWLACSGAALAQTAVSPAGRLLASGCFQCHGSGGVGGFERLAGRGADDLVRELQRLRAEDEREAGQNIMVRHARGYSDAQIHALAQWLSRQPR
jgi:cytochrome c553